MANAGNIALVIRSIIGEIADENEHIGFSMGTYVSGTTEQVADMSGRGCGTVACIAGHAYLLARHFNVEKAMNEDPDDIENIAAEYLGIDAENAAYLFYDLPEGIDLNKVTSADAINTLNHLAKTGQVEWRIQ